MGNYNDALLEQLADRGDGFYAYVDDIDEARRLFVEDLTGTLMTVALDARVQVEFDPDAVRAYRLLGFENRAIDDDEFRDPQVDAGAIGAGHASTALYALQLEDPDAAGPFATVSLRWKDPDSRRELEVSEDIDAADLASTFRATDEHFKLDAVVAAAAEVLRESEFAGDHGLRDVASTAEEISAALPQTDQVHDFLELLRRAARLTD